MNSQANHTKTIMKKRVLKYGGKSGLLPEVRPVFKRYPIRPPSEKEQAAFDKIEQGYAEGVPVPKSKGLQISRKPIPKPVLTVDERIKMFIEDRRPKVEDESKLNEQEKWELKKDNIRREYLKEAYKREEERLSRLDELKAKKDASDAAAKSKKQHTGDSESTKLTLPTIDSYLQGSLMRNRTPNEEAILKEKRTLNRKTLELKEREKKANQLLELYHSAAKFITTEEELNDAVHQAFEVDVGRFDSNISAIGEKLRSGGNVFTNLDKNANLLQNHALGQINGKPGLQAIKETISGRAQKLKIDADLANENSSS